jgi:transcriptional regulator with XRE-family HTH domain
MASDDNDLGIFLKERRARLDPADYGFPVERRRTPGLRREEVAQRAHVSATWYTWLEQGRGGAPSADVLDRLARALRLNEAEREHLYLLAQQRPPRVERAGQSGVSPGLQRVIDAFGDTPAIIKTPEWTVLAWNRAASVVLADYSGMEMGDRNLLRGLFGGRRAHLVDWEGVARLVVGTVRRDLMRAGMSAETEALIAELSESSAEFRRMWAAGDVLTHGEGTKQIRHATAGLISLEFSTFSVDGHPDLGLVVFNPATDADREKVRRLMAG